MSPSRDNPSRVSLAARFRQLLGKARRVVRARSLGAELLLCGGCGQKLRVPIMSRTIRVTCPRCRRQTMVAPKTYPGAGGVAWSNTTISAKRALAYLGGAERTFGELHGNRRVKDQMGTSS
jgi:DNA-directed RNA polymerase subunit RPC12/RpoP